MRQIKFRAWDKQYKQMAQVTHIDFITNEIDHDKNLSEPKSIEHFGLMQFTGLLDKNGKEIYEGDILRYYPCEEEPIFFHGLAFVDTTRVGGELKIIRCDNLGGEATLDSSSFWNDDREVIGNLYENPELLNEVKNG